MDTLLNAIYRSTIPLFIHLQVDKGDQVAGNLNRSVIHFGLKDLSVRALSKDNTEFIFVYREYEDVLVDGTFRTFIPNAHQLLCFPSGRWRRDGWCCSR